MIWQRTWKPKWWSNFPDWAGKGLLSKTHAVKSHHIKSATFLTLKCGILLFIDFLLLTLWTPHISWLAIYLMVMFSLNSLGLICARHFAFCRSLHPNFWYCSVPSESTLQCSYSWTLAGLQPFPGANKKLNTPNPYLGGTAAAVLLSSILTVYFWKIKCYIQIHSESFEKISTENM